MPTTITKEMTFQEVLNLNPDSVNIMAQYGLHCFGCHMSVFETVEQGAAGHGMTPEQVDTMVEEINAAAAS